LSVIGFILYPQILWTTLWMDWGNRAQVRITIARLTKWSYFVLNIKIPINNDLSFILKL